MTAAAGAKHVGFQEEEHGPTTGEMLRNLNNCITDYGHSERHNGKTMQPWSAGDFTVQSQ